jgi:predicted nucleotidyltransferase component of viral defense system
LIFETEIIDGIRFYDARDIAAMKIQAILRRGQKKDFFDIYELLKHYNLDNIIKFYNLKYSHQELFVTIPQAITYFEEADESEDPISLRNESWDEVKKGLQKVVNEYLK